MLPSKVYGPERPPQAPLASARKEMLVRTRGPASWQSLPFEIKQTIVEGALKNSPIDGCGSDGPCGCGGPCRVSYKAIMKQSRSFSLVNKEIRQICTPILFTFVYLPSFDIHTFHDLIETILVPYGHHVLQFSNDRAYPKRITAPGDYEDTSDKAFCDTDHHVQWLRLVGRALSLMPNLRAVDVPIFDFGDSVNPASEKIRISGNAAVSLTRVRKLRRIRIGNLVGSSLGEASAAKILLRIPQLMDVNLANLRAEPRSEPKLKPTQELPPPLAKVLSEMTEISTLYLAFIPSFGAAWCSIPWQARSLSELVLMHLACELTDLVKLIRQFAGSLCTLAMSAISTVRPPMSHIFQPYNPYDSPDPTKRLQMPRLCVLHILDNSLAALLHLFAGACPAVEELRISIHGSGCIGAIGGELHAFPVPGQPRRWQGLKVLEIEGHWTVGTTPRVSRILEPDCMMRGIELDWINLDECGN